MADRALRVKVDVPKGMTDVGYSADTFREGEIVYLWTGASYGVIATGIAVTRTPGEYPFFEIPAICVEPASTRTDGGEV
jgi:hypothetical protein